MICGLWLVKITNTEFHGCACYVHEILPITIASFDLTVISFRIKDEPH